MYPDTASVHIMQLASVLLLMASISVVFTDQDSCDLAEKKAECDQSDILERIDNVEKKVAGLKHINDKIEQLSKITYDLKRSSGAASEKKIKMDVQ